MDGDVDITGIAEEAGKAFEARDFGKVWTLYDAATELCERADMLPPKIKGYIEHKFAKAGVCMRELRKNARAHASMFALDKAAKAV